MATCANIPFDVVKSRLQQQRAGDNKYTSFHQAFRMIVKEEGIRTLWSGLEAKVLRMGVGGAAGIVIFESIVSLIERL